LDHWAPDILVVSEGEFWPRILTKLVKSGTPLISINTKMTDKSFMRWLWLPGLAKTVLRTFDLILAQDQQAAQKLKRLGARDGNIRVTGSMTATKKLLQYDEALYSSLSSAIGNRSVWFAAATNRDEEDVLVNAHKIAMRRNRRLLLILQTREEMRGQNSPSETTNISGDQ
jgi:3-deoxy-D-manno-octulosonic-acid transferase